MYLEQPRNWILYKLTLISFAIIDSWVIPFSTLHQVKLTITPNLYSPEKQQSIVVDDYAMKNKELKITTRRALVHYYLRRMGITQDEGLLKKEPEMHQLIAFLLNE